MHNLEVASSNLAPATILLRRATFVHGFVGIGSAKLVRAMTCLLKSEADQTKTRQDFGGFFYGKFLKNSTRYGNLKPYGE